jgi:hypothetical protein
MPVTSKSYVQLEFYGDGKIVLENLEGIDYKLIANFIKNPRASANKITIGNHLIVDLNMMEYHVQGFALSEKNAWFASGMTNAIYKIPINIPIVKVLETIDYFYHLYGVDPVN